MPGLNEKLLARYYDGELSPKKAAWVEQQLDKSPDYQVALKKMSNMSDLIHLMNEETLEDVSFAGFETRVRAGIGQGERPGFFEKLQVWASEFIEHRRTIWVPSMAVATVAVAVLIAMPFVTGGPSEAPPATTDNGIWMASTPGTKAPSSTIVSVGSNDKTGSKYHKYDVPSGEGGTLGVVWIDEKP
ncbi:MAG: hypothetical protein GY854_11665 [Deltaproteobacteria bacterium]|nr:hypothetical protein [Deltaproteobacteria bacterium]